MEQQFDSPEQSDNGKDELGISGTVNFDEAVDGNGDGHYKFSQYGGGAKVHATAVIEEPANGVFDIDVRSSDGGKIVAKGIKAGTEVSGTLSTSFFHSTTVKGDLHCSIPNVRVKGKIHYKI